MDVFSGVLFRYNLNTGDGTGIGLVGRDVSGLDFHPATGVLYGWSDATDQLLTINLQTGAGTPVGPSNIIGSRPPVGGVGLTFDAAGNLWLADEGSDLPGFNSNNGAIWAVDPNTGAATFRANTGRAITALASQGTLIFGIDDIPPIGSRFDTLVVVDPQTGLSPQIGDIGFLFNGAGMDFDPLTRTLWGIDGFTGTLLKIDPLTGESIIVGRVCCGLDNGLQSLAIPAVPEPSSLLLLGSGLAGLALLRRRFPS